MLDIILSGCNGRMGHALEAQCSTDTELNIVAGFEILGTSERNFPIFAVPSEFSGSADVVVDFSHPAALSSLLSFCLQRRLPIVLATTGYSQAQLAEIEDASQSIPIFRSGNFSLGVNVLLELVRQAGAMLGEDFDVEIIERHHSKKVDAPSGTALMLVEALAVSLPYEPEYVYDRHMVRRPREHREIGISSVRGGTIAGDHEVLFAGKDEIIELRHCAQSREVFAAGALKAARYLAGRDAPGLYGMRDLTNSLLEAQS